jgi:ribulose-5-phosphate 4-epimerase/fuculose-1-phosphate aldolase
MHDLSKKTIAPGEQTVARINMGAIMRYRSAMGAITHTHEIYAAVTRQMTGDHNEERGRQCMACVNGAV